MPDMPPKEFEDEGYLRRLFSVPFVDSFDISRDGRIAYFSNNDGQFQLYMVELDGSITRMTVDPERKTFPFFTTEDELVYFSDVGGDEKFDLYRLEIGTGGEERTNVPIDITPGTDYAIIPFVSYSADRRIASLVANRDGNFACYIMEKGGGGLKRITNHRYADERADLSPDGKKVAVTALVSGQENAVFIVDHESGGVTAISDMEKGENIEASSPCWSPDGNRIAFKSAERGYSDIGLYDIRNGGVTWLTEGTRECGSPVISPDGMKIAYTVNEGGRIGAVVRDLASGTVEKEISPFPGYVDTIKFSPDSKEIYFLFSSVRNSFDLFRYNLAEGRCTQVTNSIPKDIDTSYFVDAREVTFRSRPDGLNIPALLFLPSGWDGRSKLPAVVDIHGGPAWQSLNMWNPLIQALVARGMAVIAPNYRGSTGYGRKFREANRHVMGVADLNDCVSAAEYLVDSGIAEKGRIAVTGGSFGGYLTMCALTKYPDEWVCGSAVIPFLNWFTEMENEREDLRYWDEQNMGDPVKDRERLRNASPFFFLDRIRAPVQMIAGANDPRCPLEESRQAAEEMERLGKSVEFHYYPDEGHGFSKRENRVDAALRVLGFIENHISERSR